MANSVAAKTTPKGDGIFVRMSRFLRESYIEVGKKASWPSWDELKKSTAVVILAVVVVGIYIASIDGILSRITNPIFGFGPK